MENTQSINSVENTQPKKIKVRKTDDPHYQKKYRIKDKENPIICDLCGTQYLLYNKSHHVNTKRHKYNLLQKEMEEVKRKLEHNIQNNIPENLS